MPWPQFLRNNRPKLLDRIPGFDVEFYTANYPDAPKSAARAEAHYLNIGMSEGRDPNPYFSTTGYLAANPDVAASGINPLLHFHYFGIYEGRTGWEREIPFSILSTLGSSSADDPLRGQATSSMRIVAITRILDESDIVEAFVRHTAVYASHHVFIDNGSRDGTIEILQSLADEGFSLTVFRNRSISFNEISFNTEMFNYAIQKCRADWVLPLDTDEFIDDREVEGGIIDALKRESQKELIDFCIQVPLIEYESTPDDSCDEIVVPRRLRRRSSSEVTKKVFIHSSPSSRGITVEAGNHHALRDGEALPFRKIPGLCLAHYPRRSPYQLAAKSIKGWAKVLAADPEEIARGTSGHYKDFFSNAVERLQSILSESAFTATRDIDLNLITDPINYKGGELRYTRDTDELVRALRGVIGYLNDLAQRHGRLLHEVPAVRNRVKTWDSHLERVI